MFPSEEAREAYRDGLADARQGHPARAFSEDAPVAIKTAYRRGWKNYRSALKQSQQLSPELNDDEIFVKSMELLWASSVKECKPAKGMRGIIMALNDPPVFRVYLRDEDGDKIRDDRGLGFEYIDYDIQHYDFDVTIDEDHAVLVTFNDGREILDYPLDRYKCNKID